MCQRFSQRELAERASLRTRSDVSQRTVQLYITRGYIPPALGSGPNRYYTAKHLERLCAIVEQREARLTLPEIVESLDDRD